MSLEESEAFCSGSDEGSGEDTDFSYQDYATDSSKEPGEEEHENRSSKQARRQMAKEAMLGKRARTHPPRTIEEIAADIESNKLLELKSRHESKYSIMAQIYELAEFRNAKIHWKVSDAERMEAIIIPYVQPLQSHHVIANFQVKSQTFVITKSEAYQWTQGTPSGRSSTSYRPCELVLISTILSGVKKNPSLPETEILDILKPYLRKTVSQHQITKIRQLAKDIISGKPEGEMCKLGHVVQHLEEQGHVLDFKQKSVRKGRPTGKRKAPSGNSSSKSQKKNSIEVVHDYNV
jgi:hypothetical protein